MPTRPSNPRIVPAVFPVSSSAGRCRPGGARAARCSLRRRRRRGGTRHQRDPGIRVGLRIRFGFRVGIRGRQLLRVRSRYNRQLRRGRRRRRRRRHHRNVVGVAVTAEAATARRRPRFGPRPSQEYCSSQLLATPKHLTQGGWARCRFRSRHLLLALASAFRPTTVTAVERHPGHTVLRTRSGPAEAISVACQPDVEAAKRHVRSVRRIDRVELTVSGERCRASVRGTGHRLPFEATIPAAVGLGLAELGIRTTIQRSDVSDPPTRAMPDTVP